MFYQSTRQLSSAPLSFSQIVLEGLAPDGGLYMPMQYPQINHALKDWLNLSYAEVASQVLGLFCKDIPSDVLAQLTHKTYTANAFKYARGADADEITPLRYIGSEQNTPLYLLELSNGPTLAFKDMAMQLLGNLFEYLLKTQNKTMTILGATSGDTGSAAEYAMRSKENIRVFMLSPHEKMSPFQQAQMFGLMDDNIFNISIPGFFDTCQDLVKQVTNDANFKAKYHLSTVNSINWARICAQTIYYIKGYLNLVKQGALKLGDCMDVCVPSGNFGNICAGYIAKRMGLPIAQLICATNENNVLDELFKTGSYKPRNLQQTYETSSPSMDISKASNIERLMFDAFFEASQNKTQAAQLTRNAFAQVANLQAVDMNAQAYQYSFQAIKAYGFISGCSNHTNRLHTIANLQQQNNIIIDPHTADGVFVAKQHLQQRPMLVLETAQAAKFEQTIEQALGFIPPRHQDFINLEQTQKRNTLLSDDVNAVKAYIQAQTP